jgi:hypothetical protein
MSYGTTYLGFSEREEAIVRFARELCPVMFGAAGLTIRRGSLPLGTLGQADRSPTGRHIITLDFDQMALPRDAWIYLVLHEISHCAGGHVALYERLARATSLSVADKRAIRDGCELAADQAIEAWGLRAYIDVWKAVFPDDERDAAWAKQVATRFNAVRDRIARKVGVSV